VVAPGGAIVTALGLAVTALVLRALVGGRAARDASRRARVERRLPAAPSTTLARRPFPPPGWFVAAHEATALPIEADVTFALCGLATVTAAVGGFVAGGPVLATLALGAVGATFVVGERLLRHRAADRYAAVLPVALEVMAGGLRSGGSLALAVAEAGSAVGGPVGRDLDRVSTMAQHGTPLADALDAWAARRDQPGVALAAAALALGVETGGAQARAVDGVATTLRDRLAVVSEVRALASQARSSALLLTIAPVVFCGLSTMADPRVGRFLFHTAGGTACLLGGFGLDVVAGLWMGRLVRSAR
jgi:tight adherence protein B